MEPGKEISIEELFRRKLENAELVPGSSVNARLMKKLGRREFMRFNPARFNIYYAGLIVAAVAAAVILLSSQPGSDKRKPSSSAPVQQTETPLTSPAVNRSASARKPGKKISARTSDKQTVIVNAVSPSNSEDVKIIPDQPISTAEVNTMVNNKGIAGAKSPETQKLREPVKNTGALFIPSSVAGCVPLKVSFRNAAEGYEKFSWSFGDGGESDKKEPVWVYDAEGDYTVILKATGRNGETAVYSSRITVYPKPGVSFETNPPNAIIPDDEITFLNNSTGAMSYRWDFGDGSTSSLFEPKHRYSRFEKYNVTLTATSENGCSDTFVVPDAFSGSGFFIRMPNAFIPNPQGPSGGFYSSKSDESAEIFHPVWSGVAEYHLQIFSKIGILLFESNDAGIGWDGYFKGQLCNPGVYLWKLTGTFSNGESFIKKGDVTLLKN